MTAKTQWHGDNAESLALVEAVAHNCGCTFGAFSIRLSTCAPHKAMVEDQRFLDGMLFARRMRARFWTPELDTPEPAPIAA